MSNKFFITFLHFSNNFLTTFPQLCHNFPTIFSQLSHNFLSTGWLTDWLTDWLTATVLTLSWHCRASQEFFRQWLLLTSLPLGIYQLNSLKKIKLIKLEVICLVFFFKIGNPNKSENFTALYNILMGVQGSTMVG